MSTFLELCADLAEQVGMSSAPASVVGQTGENKKIVDRIAQADLEIQNMWQDWNFLFSASEFSQALTVDDATYDGPSDLGTFDEDSFYIDRTLDTYQKLDELDYKIWRRDYRNGTQVSGTPTNFAITSANGVVLYPPPDSAYTLTADYWVAPSVMTGNTDVSKIPEQFHRIIVVKAKMYYAEEDDAPEVMRAAMMEFKNNNNYGSLLDQLEAFSLPKNKNRRRAEGPAITVVPE